MSIACNITPTHSEVCSDHCGQLRDPPLPLPPPPRSTRPPHLDPAHRFLGLHHAHVFGGSFVGEQLGRAKVIGSKNDSID